MDTDVLVVGAGPTGLMLANQLVRRGVRVLIIDRHSGPSMQTRALGVQARTLEIYAKLGIVDRALELGKPGTGANMWAQGRKTARVPRCVTRVGAQQRDGSHRGIRHRRRKITTSVNRCESVSRFGRGGVRPSPAAIHRSQTSVEPARGRSEAPY